MEINKKPCFHRPYPLREPSPRKELHRFRCCAFYKGYTHDTDKCGIFKYQINWEIEGPLSQFVKKESSRDDHRGGLHERRHADKKEEHMRAESCKR